MQKDMQPKDAKPVATSPGDEVAPGTPGSGEDICPNCHSSGQVNGQDCENCSGTGLITKAIGGA